MMSSHLPDGEDDSPPSSTQPVVNEIFKRLAALQEALTNWPITKVTENNISAISIARKLYRVHKRALITCVKYRLLAFERSTLRTAVREQFLQNQTLICNLRTLDKYVKTYDCLALPANGVGRQKYRSPLELQHIRQQLVTEICRNRNLNDETQQKLQKFQAYMQRRAQQFASYFHQVIQCARRTHEQCKALEAHVKKTFDEAYAEQKNQQEAKKTRRVEREKRQSERIARLTESGNVLADGPYRILSHGKKSDKNIFTEDTDPETPEAMKTKRRGLELEYREQIAQNTRKLAKLEKALSAARAERIQATDQLRPIQTTLQTLEEALIKAQSATNEYRARVEERQTIAERMRNETKASRIESRRAQELIQQREDEFDACVHRRDTLQREINAATLVVQSATAKIKNTQTAVEACDIRRRLLGDQKRQLQRACTNLDAKTAEKLVEINHIRTARMERDERKQDIEAQIETLRAETEQCDTTHREFDRKTAQLQEKLTRVRENANLAEKLTADQQVKLACNKAHEEQLKTRLEEVSCMREQYMQALVGEQRTKQEQQDRLRLMFTTLNEREQSVKRSKREIFACQSEQVTLSEQLNNCCRRMLSVQQRNERLQVNLGTLRDEPLLPDLRLDERNYGLVSAIQFVDCNRRFLTPHPPAEAR